MPKIAHISDIHFGKTFDVAVWNNVQARIVEFSPNLLVVSGDLVDHPWPFRMLAVKAELLNLCKKCPSKPQLFVVPGNHDVRFWGNVRPRLRPRWLERLILPEWFERIMFGDTEKAKIKIEAALGIPLGLNAECKKLTWRRRLKRFNPANSIRRNVKADTCDKRLQTCDRHRAGGAWPSESLHCCVSIVCFDSNPAKGRGIAFASGEVGQTQITRLDRGRMPEQVGPCPLCRSPVGRTADGVDPVLLRVAVLHHHPLPIALTAAAFRNVRQEGKLEPYLLLRNSGDLLQQLQNYKFDLVLHGHKHRPQFARLELNTDGVDPYPLTVLAAGSTAKDDEDRANNTLRLIETEPNGRLTVRTVKRGEAWDEEDEPYQEELSKLKQRAFSRARELTKRTAGLLRSENSIDPVGNVKTTTEVAKLRLLSGPAVETLPVLLSIPAHGLRFDDLIQIDEKYRDAMRLRWRAEDKQLYDFDDIPKDQRGHCCIELNQALQPGLRRTVDYHIHRVVSNSIAMNGWELAERTRVNSRLKGRGEYESIWRYVAYPTDRLQLRLTLPPNLGDVRPEFCCRRAPRYPEFPLTFDPDVIMDAVRRGADPVDYDDFKVDEDLQKEEKHKLSYHPGERAWDLDIEYPVPGYIYELRWKVPAGDIAETPVCEGTIVRQTMLLDLRDRLSVQQVAASGTDAETLDVDRECCELFGDFSGTLMRELAGMNPKEKQAVFLMIYDRRDLALHPVQHCLSWPGAPPKSFSVPLGQGIAGVAFQQNKVIAWGQTPDGKSLIRPEPLPGLEPQYVLALPIFYVGHQHRKLVNKTGAVVGVVTVASDSPGSQIRYCRGDGDAAVKRRTEIQLGAQAVAMKILQRLSRKKILEPDSDMLPSQPSTNR